MKQDHNSKLKNAGKNLHNHIEPIGNILVELFHYLALFAIGGMTVWAGVITAIDIFAKNSASIDDILLMFIYLELGAMVGIYFKTNHMPVRFLIYVAITALTRMMISDISHHHDPNMSIIYISVAILLLAFAVLVIRYGSARFPSVKRPANTHEIGDEES